jgi:dihydrodipicolinate synthase/N-acetylneuraminate lyase
MFVTKKYHNQVIEHKDKSINDSQARVLKLEQELKEARDLKNVLEKVTDKMDFYGKSIAGFDGLICGGELILPQQYAKFVDDYFGGKVIEQTANKVVIIGKDGTVRYAKTAKPNDKGYGYKLIRE